MEAHIYRRGTDARGKVVGIVRWREGGPREEYDDSVSWGEMGVGRETWTIVKKGEGEMKRKKMHFKQSSEAVLRNVFSTR
jgi:hypothetical protein